MDSFIPKMASDSDICSSVGSMLGMIELMNAFVILDDRPEIFIGVGILNN